LNAIIFCTNKPGLTKSIHVIPGLSDHEIVCVDCDPRARVNKKPPRKIHLWSKADWSNIKQAMVEFRDEFLAKFHLRSVEDNYQVFKGVVHSLLDSYIPSKITSSRFNMPWFNNTLKRLCNKEQRLFNKAKRTRKAQHWEQYKSFKKDLPKVVRRQRWCYINDMLQVGLDQSDSKPFWRYVKA